MLRNYFKWSLKYGHLNKDDFYDIIFITNHGNMFELVHRKIFNVFEFIEKYQNMEKRLERDIKKIVKCYLDDSLLEYDEDLESHV